MTSLIERLRAEAKRVGTSFVRSVQTEDIDIREAARFGREDISFGRNGPEYVALNKAATALEQARELLMKASPTMHWKWLKDYDAWLRLIDGEQEKEG